MKQTVRIYVIAFAAALGGLLFGYDTAVISGTISALDYNLVSPRNLPATDASSLLGFVVASALLGTIVGAAIAGRVASYFGRRRSLVFAAIVFFVSAIGSAIPEIGISAIGSAGPEVLGPFVFYRILGGMGIGLASVIVPMYIAEMSPPERRGRLVSVYQFAIVTGIVGVYFVNYLISNLGNEAWLWSVGWRLMFASEAIFALLFGGCMLFMPESPRWLFMRGKDAEARRVLLSFSDTEKTQKIEAEIQVSLQSQPAARLLTFGWAVLAIGIALSVFQQFVGINAVLYYAPSIFEDMGVGTNAAFLQTVLVGAVNFAFTAIAFIYVDRFGRKPLLVVGGAMMFVSMSALGLLFYFQMTGSGALIAILVYIAAFALSWGPVVWVLLSELFPNAIRDKALSIAVTAQWISNFVVSWSFNIMNENPFLTETFHNAFAYWLYGVVSLCAAIFVWKFVPETKQKSLEEIESLWRRS